jgi:SAM-dependent methyltransferase
MRVAEPDLPFPPLELANRVGSLAGAPRPLEYYDELGRSTRDGIVERMPSDWTFHGKRVLDFGCGAGRTLRHFAAEASAGEFWGCDIDEASIDWMKEHMAPPFQAFVNAAEPPLDQPDASFDLIWAISVFTHLSSSWSRWLVELHRLLKPNALLFVTFMGRGMSEEIAGEPWDENSFGMNVIKYGQSWDLGGPMIVHSPWWIEEHWGRAFEILSLEPDGFGAKPWLDHGSVLMRRRDREIDAEELERIGERDPREPHALAHNVKQLHAEALELREGLAYMNSKLTESIEQRRLLDTQMADLTGTLERERKEKLELRELSIAAQKLAATATQQADSARARTLHSAQRLLAVEENLAQSKARIFALEGAVEELERKLERADRVMAAMRASVSWRVTAPLRMLKRR